MQRSCWTRRPTSPRTSRSDSTSDDEQADLLPGTVYNDVHARCAAVPEKYALRRRWNKANPPHCAFCSDSRSSTSSSPASATFLLPRLVVLGPGKSVWRWSRCEAETGARTHSPGCCALPSAVQTIGRHPRSRPGSSGAAPARHESGVARNPISRLTDTTAHSHRSPYIMSDQQFTSRPSLRPSAQKDASLCIGSLNGPVAAGNAAVGVPHHGRSSAGAKTSNGLGTRPQAHRQNTIWALVERGIPSMTALVEIRPDLEFPSDATSPARRRCQRDALSFFGVGRALTWQSGVTIGPWCQKRDAVERCKRFFTATAHWPV